MNLRQLPRRALAAASSVFIGVLGGAVASTGPVAAQAPPVESSCSWDQESRQWQVSWTVTVDPPAGASGFRLADVETAPGANAVEGIGTSPEGTYPHDPDEPLVGVQRLGGGATAASLTVHAEWDTLQRQDYHGEIAIPAGCTLPGLSSEWRLECDAVIITIRNPTDGAVTLTFDPNTGNSVPVEVAAGGYATVEFPPSDGLAVDVLLDNRSIVDPERPVAVTSADLAALRCDEQADDEGGGGGLPATGTSTLIVAVGALALLGAGTGLYLLARRRRIRFTA